MTNSAERGLCIFGAYSATAVDASARRTQIGPAWRARVGNSVLDLSRVCLIKLGPASVGLSAKIITHLMVTTKTGLPLDTLRARTATLSLPRTPPDDDPTLIEPLRELFTRVDTGVRCRTSSAAGCAKRSRRRSAKMRGLRARDDGHAVVHIGDESSRTVMVLVQDLSGRAVLPLVPESGERELIAVGTREVVGLLAFWHLLPFAIRTTIFSCTLVAPCETFATCARALSPRQRFLSYFSSKLSRLTPPTIDVLVPIDVVGGFSETRFCNSIAVIARRWPPR